MAPTPAIAALLLLACLWSETAGQYESGPIPPRLQIPGALPTRGRAPQALPVGAEQVAPRRRVALRGGGAAARAGGGSPRAGPAGRSQTLVLPPRPVIEAEPEPQTTYQPTYQTTTYQPPAFRPSPIADLPVPNRQQYSRGPPSEEAAFARGTRPPPQQQQQQSAQEESDEGSDEQSFTATVTRARPTTPQEDVTSFTRSGDDQGLSRQQPQPAYQPEPVSYQRTRPAVVARPPPPPQEDNSIRGRNDLKSSYNRAQLQARPRPQAQPLPQQQPSGPRQRKPVAQVIQKYRNDNPDGSITWGFENDDGTFKEETIGNDCVTRGKYGYIDPDGVRREYSYESGILCDKNAPAADSEAGATNEGYIDYEKNIYVLPNGSEVGLDKMVKNRARRPVAAPYRN